LTHWHADLKGKSHVKLDIDRVKAAIELNGIGLDIGAAKLGAFYAHVVGAGDQILAHGGQEYANVLKAISVTAGIQNARGLDAEALTTGRRTRTGKSGISHRIQGLLIDFKPQKRLFPNILCDPVDFDKNLAFFIYSSTVTRRAGSIT
jgi:hypothetical protein